MGVGDPCAETLPPRGAVDVRGVAGQEDSSDAIAVREPCVDGEGADPVGVFEGQSTRAALVDESLHGVERGLLSTGSDRC